MEGRTTSNQRADIEHDRSEENRDHRFFRASFTAGWSDTPRVTIPPCAVEAIGAAQGPASTRAVFPPLPAIAPSRETVSRSSPFDETILPA
jgi:hypothetical protein